MSVPLSKQNSRQSNLAYTQIGSTKVLFLIIALLAIIAGIYVQGSTKNSYNKNSYNKAEAELPPFEKTVILPVPRAIKAATFTDHNGLAFGPERFKNKWSIVFFGFTNCPDICPSTLRILKDVKQQVAEAGLWDGYQVVMVSVDPERDTPEKLGAYVPFFDAEFVGVTAALDVTREFAKSVGALFIKRENDRNDEWYDVDHSASLILVNPQGEWAGAITAPHRTEQITSDLIQLAEYYGAGRSNQGVVESRHEARIGGASSAGTSLSPSAGASQAALEIQKAWIRPAPNNARSLAAYFKLVNNSESDITIVDSQSPDFDITMIHDTQVEDGLARMIHMDELVIPAGQYIELKPLGLHMMLMQPKSSFVKGSVAQITLIGDQGQRYTAEIEVREQPQ